MSCVRGRARTGRNSTETPRRRPAEGPRVVRSVGARRSTIVQALAVKIRARPRLSTEQRARAPSRNLCALHEDAAGSPSWERRADDCPDEERLRAPRAQPEAASSLPPVARPRASPASAPSAPSRLAPSARPTARGLPWSHWLANSLGGSTLIAPPRERRLFTNASEQAGL
jgi:hypothetical protein